MATGAARKVWLVTGAASRLGRAVVEYALSQGDKVSATCQTPSKLSELQSKWPPSQLIVLKLDVTSLSDITAGFEQTTSAFGRVDVVYNNARYTEPKASEAQETQDDGARRSFDVEYWGGVNVSREAVKQFHEINDPVGGLLLQPSMTSLDSHPGAPFYCARFALEGYLDALSRELRPSWNIRVKLVGFGAFATPVVVPSVDGPIQPVRAALASGSSREQFDESEDSGHPMVYDVTKVAEGVYNISREEHKGVLRVPLRLGDAGRTGEGFEETKAALKEDIGTRHL